MPKAISLIKSTLPLIGLLCSSTVFAQQYTDLSLLRAMDQQSQLLYRQVAMSVIRVQVPMRPATQPSVATTQPLDPLYRWKSKLSPEIRARLQSGTDFVAEVIPTSQPDVYVIQRRVAAPVSSTPGFIANVLGLVIDGQGHAMLPTYVSDAYKAQSFPVLLSDGSVAQARFVGSDRKTRLTVIQVDRAGLPPAIMIGGQPPDGSLVLSIALDPNQTHLGVWTRFSDSWGIVARSDGSLAGFSGHGQFLSAAACAPVVRQLIQFGHVQRPILGIGIRNVLANDPQRMVDATLGQIPAIRIWQVLAGSPADRAGLHEGDLILTLAGEPVGDETSFAAAIAERRGPTQLTILRQDQIITVTVDLEK